MKNRTIVCCISGFFLAGIAGAFAQAPMPIYTDHLVNGPAALQDIAQSVVTNIGTTFTHDFPPLSMTLFTLAPEPSDLVPLPPVINDEFVIELHGQSNVPYTIEGSSDAVGWLPVSTNTPSGSTVTVTNPAGPDVHFWRANWKP